MKKTLLLTLLLHSFYVRGWSSEPKTIALMKMDEVPQYDLAVEGFKKTFADRGIRFEIVEFDSKRKNADLVLTVGSKATKKILSEGVAVPVVFSMVMQPEKSGFDRANMAGVSMDVPPEDQLQMLKRLIPGAKNVGVIYNPKETQDIVDRIRAETRRQNMNLIAIGVDSVEDVYSAIRSIGDRIDVLWMTADSTVYTLKSTEDVLLYTLREKIPVIGLSPPYVKAGALFSLSCDYLDVGKQAGEIAVSILEEGKNRSTIAQPRKTFLSINLIAAERFGIKVPLEIITNAKNVYN